MIAVVPGYISRSVAGSYDNEGTGPAVTAQLSGLRLQKDSESVS